MENRMPLPPASPPRRSVLQYGAGLAAALAAPALRAQPAVAAAHASAAGAAAPTGRLRDFLLMRGALDDRVVVGTLSGQYYGVVDDELTPLFGLLSATFSRYRPLSDGHWLEASFEHAYYTDIDSGAVLAEWRNPYNGKTGPVPVVSSEPRVRLLAADLTFRLQKAAPPGFSVESRVVAIEEQADDLVIVERVRAAMERPAPARPYRYSELVTLRSSLAALRDPAARRVPCSTGFVNVSGWRPWLQMGDQPGHLMAQGAGRYGAEIESLPRAWLEATRRGQPDIVADPARRLEALFRG
jgi:hypothetical protein